MNVISRILKALNQAYQLVFQSIAKGVRIVYRAIKNVIRVISDLIKALHEFLTTAIQLVLNISSIIFVLFIPFGFFFDPLGWSNYLGGFISQKAIFWVRMLFGAFFSLVATLLLSSLYSSWKQAGGLDENREQQQSNEQNKGITEDNVSLKNEKADFVREFASLLSWLLLAGGFVYFTVFRYQLLGLEIPNIDLPRWLKL